jgi:hypothetical protein
MLTSIRLRNFRSYVDTHDIDFRKLNVFIGANNAGKSAFLSAVELLLKSFDSATSYAPLPFEEIPSFASFDSVLRRHWSPGEARPKEFILEYGLSLPKSASLSLSFTCKGRPSDNISYVDEAVYTWPKVTITMNIKDSTSTRPKYNFQIDGKAPDTDPVFFHGPVPYIIDDPTQTPAEFLQSVYIRSEVVHPYRPVPRSFYVLDDPNLSPQDRKLLSFLLEIWQSKEHRAQRLKARVIENLKTLGLITHLDIRPIARGAGPKVIKIHVAPKHKRQALTIADVGFGLSQVLPLAAFDARLNNGCLIAYQPELHLHPLAQSRLADLFSGSVQHGNQVFVETHSPDLILRLQAKVAAAEIPADAVRVFCLHNDRGHTTITPVDFDPKGTPQIPWPPGFLDTTLMLARNLIATRAERDK